MDIQRKLIEMWRVLQVTKKPDRQEYFTIARAAGLGIAIIGVVGFLLHLFKQIFIPG